MSKKELMSLDWWTPREVATRFRVSESTVLRMAARGELAGKQIGRQWRFHSSVLDVFEKSAKVPSNLVVETNWSGLQNA